MFLFTPIDNLHTTYFKLFSTNNLPCGVQNQKNCNFCSESGNKFVISVTDQEKEYKKMVAVALESKLNAINSGIYMEDLNQFKETVKNYRKKVYNLIKFQEENFDILVDEFISTQHMVRDNNYYRAMIKYGKTFSELIEEEEILHDIYFTEDQIKVFRNFYNKNLDFTQSKNTFISMNRRIGYTYSKNGEYQKQIINKSDEESYDLLEIADAALAFLSPVSAARYIIKKMKDD